MKVLFFIFILIFSNSGFASDETQAAHSLFGAVRLMKGELTKNPELRERVASIAESSELSNPAFLEKVLMGEAQISHQHLITIARILDEIRGKKVSHLRGQENALELMRIRRKAFDDVKFKKVVSAAFLISTTIFLLNFTAEPSFHRIEVFLISGAALLISYFVHKGIRHIKNAPNFLELLIKAGQVDSIRKKTGSFAEITLAFRQDLMQQYGIRFCKSLTK